MEEILEELVLKPVEYSALFDAITGEVLSVGPSTAFNDLPNTVSVEKDLAEMIIEGKINIFNCAVDTRNMTFELLEKKTVYKIDDVLHRIVETKWTMVDNPDIFISYNSDLDTLTFEMSEEFNGTYVLPEKYQPVTKRKIIWDGETVLNFYVTRYNDPHILYKKIDILLKDLIDSKIVINDVDLPEKFSVYTRRVLKNYILKIE